MNPAQQLRSRSSIALFPDGGIETAAELGAVTADRVRLWVRHPGADTFAARLLVEGSPPLTASVSLSGESDWTGVIEFRLPAPCPEAAFICEAGDRRLAGRLAPEPGKAAPLTFAIGSCNRPFETAPDGSIHVAPVARIYAAMIEDLRQADGRFVLLIGDQIYSDELPSISIRDELPGDEQHPPPLDVAIEAYRRISRGFLGQREFRALREAFPTLCMWDDHDIFNNWGSRLDKTPLDYRLFEAASQVYCEYQHPRNPDAQPGPPPYFFTYRWGDIGFLALDVRGARDYEAGTLLGRQQWEAIRSHLHGPEAADVSTLFVVSSVPIAHVSRWMARLFAWAPGEGGDSVRDRWCSPAFVKSRDALLDELCAWQARDTSGRRQVILLSGDVHTASAFTIRHRHGPGVIQQFTSSALTTPHTSMHAVLNQLAVRWPNAFERQYRFKRHFMVNDNNFGRIKLVPLPGGGHRVRFDVRAWNTRRQQLYTGGRVISIPEAVRSDSGRELLRGRSSR